jgi:hypothetical protein
MRRRPFGLLDKRIPCPSLGEQVEAVSPPVPDGNYTLTVAGEASTSRLRRDRDGWTTERRVRFEPGNDLAPGRRRGDRIWRPWRGRRSKHSRERASAFIASCYDVTPVEDCQKARIGLGLPSARSPRRAVSLGAEPASLTQSMQTTADSLKRQFRPKLGRCHRDRPPARRAPARRYFQPDFDGISEKLSGFTSAVRNMIESWGA